MNLRFFFMILIAAGAHASMFWLVQQPTRPAVLPLAQAEMAVELVANPGPLPQSQAKPAARLEETLRLVEARPLAVAHSAPLVAEPDLPLVIPEAAPRPREEARPASAGTPGQNQPQGVRAAAVLGNQRPSYPPEAERRGQEGLVGVWVRVAADGGVADVQLDQSSGYPLLDEHTLRFARTLRFQPARQGDTPVPSDYYYSVRYRLER